MTESGYWPLTYKFYSLFESFTEPMGSVAALFIQTNELLIALVNNSAIFEVMF